MIGIADHIRAASEQLEVSHDFDQRVLRAVGYWEVTGRRVTRPQSLLRPLVLLAIALLAMMALIWRFLASPASPPASRPRPAPAQMAPAPAPPGSPAASPSRRAQ